MPNGTFDQINSWTFSGNEVPFQYLDFSIWVLFRHFSLFRILKKFKYNFIKYKKCIYYREPGLVWHGPIDHPIPSGLLFWANNIRKSGPI